MSYLKLKSGTDVRGIASDLGGKEVELTDKAVYDISAALVCYLVELLNKPAEELVVAVGHDSRISASRISSAVISALTDSGVNVLNCELASTPAMFMTTIDLGADASVQITASHHPFDRNGLKFFTKNGGFDSCDIEAVLKLADDNTAYLPKEKGSVKAVDYMKQYAANLRKLICESVGKSEAEQPLKNYHIVVDAGNGAGGFYATEVLEKLGADISGSQFLEPDGMFPNHIPNPENKQAMESICSAVKQNNADLGIIFDTDVDRAGCVGNDGNEINRNRLIALAALIASNGKDNCTIVTDSVTSDGLKVFLEEKLNCKHYRYKRGYKNVINKAIELCQQGVQAPLAIETSGHAALKENYFLDDGAYLVTRIVIELANGLNIEEFLSDLELPVEERECRLNIKAENFKEYGLNVINEFENYCANIEGLKIADDNREGIRVSTSYGWFLLRLSVHDPVMPMNFESKEVGGVDKMINLVTPFFEKFDQLDCSALN